MQSLAKHKRIVVTGIDTDAGKTVVSAILAHALGADYWKPVQAGLPTDSDWVRDVAGLPAERVHPEAYKLQMPASPHAAAPAEGKRVELAKLLPVPATDRPLIIEGAGGIMVPLNEKETFLDLFAAWGFPVVLVVKTYLGCINHSLLSLAALRARGVPVAGVIFNEGGRPESEGVILEMGEAEMLLKVPHFDEITPETLKKISRSYSSGKL